MRSSSLKASLTFSKFLSLVLWHPFLLFSSRLTSSLCHPLSVTKTRRLSPLIARIGDGCSEIIGIRVYGDKNQSTCVDLSFIYLCLIFSLTAVDS